MIIQPASVPADGPAHLPPEDAPRSVLAVFPLAGLLAVVSSIGILSTSVYARETANWRGQAIAQDWVDLLLTVPWLTSAAVLASRGSRRGSLLLAAGLLYTFYEFVIYGFALHFNALFLPYCAILGVCFFALIGLGIRYVQEDVGRWYPPATPVRFAGVTLLAVGLLFAFAWLAEILPALVSGELPASVAEAGTVTNPVYLIDLSIVLPAHLLAGRSLLRRRTLGLVLAPILLGFDVLMALSLAAMMGIMAERGLPSSLAAAAGMLGLAVISGLSLWLLLRGVRSAL